MQRVHIAPDEYGEGGGTGFMCAHGHLHHLGIGAIVCGLLHPYTWVTVWALAAAIVPNMAVILLAMWVDVALVMHAAVWFGLLAVCTRRFSWWFDRV